MAHPHKTNDSHTQNRYASQCVSTDGRTTAGESDPARKRSRGIKDRARDLFQRIPVMAPRSRDAQPTSHRASTRSSIDNPTEASGSFSAGRHSSSSMQNQPAQFMPSVPSQTGDDTAQHPGSISYPSADSHASGGITHPEGVERSSFTRNATATNAVPAPISYPSAGSHASGVITHPERVERNPLVKNATASNAVPVPILYPSAGSHASGVITYPERVERSPLVKNAPASNAVPAPFLYPSTGSHASGVITQRERVERSPLVKNAPASNAVPPSISYPSAGSHASVERSPLIKDATASNAVPASKIAVNRDDGTPNIIVFGESGVGKSSLINMITGTDSAATSNEAVGCTFQSTSYDVELKGRKYCLWDTIGLNEGERGTASPERSIQDLQSLVQNLQHEGVNLLIYCIRGSRIRDIIKINYDLFWKIICNEQVPIAVVVTGLENEEDMEEWWTNNREDFAARDMQFHDHACVTTTKGKRMKNGEYMYEEEYEHSVKLVRDLIIERCPKTAWKPDGSQWLGDIVQTMKQMFLQYESKSHGDEYGSRRSQARNGPAMPESLRQFIGDITMGFDRS